MPNFCAKKTRFCLVHWHHVPCNWYLAIGLGDYDHPLGLEIPVLWAFKWSTVVLFWWEVPHKNFSLATFEAYNLLIWFFIFGWNPHGFQRVSWTFFKQNSKRITRWFVGEVKFSLDESDHWIMWFWWKPFLTFGEQFRALFWNGETLDVLWIELFLDQLFASDRVRNNGSVGDLCWILGFRVFKSCEERIFRFVS